MANQVIVTNTGNVQVALTPPANVQVQISRAAIGTVANVLSANFANFAGNVTSSSQPNITSLGTLTTLSATGTATFGNVVVLGNLQVGNLVANNANYSNFAGQVVDNTQSNITAVGTLGNLSVTSNIVVGGANTVSITDTGITRNFGPNMFGTIFNFNVIGYGAGANNITLTNGGNVDVGGNLTVAGLTNSTTYLGNAAGLYNITGANVSGTVANATFANDAGNANIANTANSVDVANVVGIGNIAVINLDGNASNILFGNGTFGPEAGNLNANYANFAGQVVDNTQSNITSLGTLTSLSVTGNITGGNIITSGIVTTIPGQDLLLKAQAGHNADLMSNNGNNVMYVNDSNAYVQTVDGGGNVSLWTFGLTGNLTLPANTFAINYANGTQVPLDGPVANANYANFAGTAYSVDGANVSGTVANATFALDAGNANLANLATYATTANSVAGANVSGEVANANYSSYANIAASANSVAVANVSGIGNIANINLDGSSSNVLFGNGIFAPESTSIANANYANFAGTAFSVSGSNVSGEVANANFASYANLASTANLATFATTANAVAGANVSGEVANANYSAFANIAATANSVAVANVSGIGNIAVINLDGSSSNVLFGNGIFAPESTSIANANYANFAGTVITNAQPNITSVGNLPYLQVSNSANNIGVITQLASNAFPIVSSFANLSTYLLATHYHPNASTSYPSDRTIRSRGNATTPSPAISGDRIYNKAGLVYNGNTNVIAVSEVHTVVGTLSNIANSSFTGGQWDMTTGNPGGDPAVPNNTSWQNSLSLSNSGTLSITPGTPANTSLGQSTSSILVTSFGQSTANLVRVGGLNFQRARGNRANVQSIQANDIIATSFFYGYSNGAYQSSNVAQYRVVVDSTYANNDVVIPLSHQFQTVANVANVATFRNTNFNSNGLTQLPGNINFSTSTANLFTGTSGQIALGISAGETNQGVQSLAVGYRAGQTNQSNYALAFGDNAGANAQSQYAVAIGQYAGANLQGNNSVAFGTNAGKESQGNIAVAIGSGAGQTTQGLSAVAVGQSAGQTTQGLSAVAVGSQAGSNNQGNFSVAMGLSAGYNNQSTQSVALGYYAGANTQGQYSVAIGRQAGEFTQGANSFALGYAAASNNQGNNSIAFGWAAGFNTQGNNAIAIGARAGDTNQANNSIILNATGSILDQTTANTFTVKPVRNANTANVMFYDNSSGEISYDTLGNNTSNISAANVAINSNGFVKLANYTEAALGAITGQIGWMAAVSDSGGGGNPNGMIAFWDTTNTRWSYIHDNSAV